MLPGGSAPSLTQGYIVRKNNTFGSHLSSPRVSFLSTSFNSQSAGAWMLRAPGVGPPTFTVQRCLAARASWLSYVLLASAFPKGKDLGCVPWLLGLRDLHPWNRSPGVAQTPPRQAAVQATTWDSPGAHWVRAPALYGARSTVCGVLSPLFCQCPREPGGSTAPPGILPQFPVSTFPSGKIGKLPDSPGLGFPFLEAILPGLSQAPRGGSPPLESIYLFFHLPTLREAKLFSL